MGRGKRRESTSGSSFSRSSRGTGGSRLKVCSCSAPTPGRRRSGRVFIWVPESRGSEKQSYFAGILATIPEAMMIERSSPASSRARREKEEVRRGSPRFHSQGNRRNPKNQIRNTTRAGNKDSTNSLPVVGLVHDLPPPVLSLALALPPSFSVWDGQLPQKASNGGLPKLRIPLFWRPRNYLLIHLSVQKALRFVGSPGDPTNLVVFVAPK